MIEMLDAARAGRLKALWVIGYDILLTNPNTQRHRARVSRSSISSSSRIFS